MPLWFKKTICVAAALVTAIFILNVFCAWYYNPAPYTWDEYRATENVRTGNSFTARATEGFAWHITDENGYNNAAAPGENGIFVLMMGSSHTEGYNIAQSENTSARLEHYLTRANIQGSVYNIGTSSHDLPRNAANLNRALERFAPKGYVVLETYTVNFSKTGLMNALADSFDRLAETDVPLPQWISDMPLARTLYRQWMNLAEGSDDSAEIQVGAEYIDEYTQMLTQLMQQIYSTAKTHNVTPIIYYHPHMLPMEDGSVQAQTDEACLQAFANACEEAGVIFLDMTGHFYQAWESRNILPHGFANTAPGTGHLNAQGCDLTARALSEIILKTEAQK